MTREELQTQVNAQLKNVLKGVAEEIKSYVDGKDSVVKSELQELIDNEIAKITNLEGDLNNLKALAQSIKEVFDTDSDGSVTAEEILNKISQISGNIDEVANELGSRISANENAIAALQNSLATNYFTKEDISQALTFDAQAIRNEVHTALFGVNDNSGDGATL